MADKGGAGMDDTDKNIEMWKIKRVGKKPAKLQLCFLSCADCFSLAFLFSPLQLIKALEAARGNGTSMISLIMPPKDQASTSSEICQPCTCLPQGSQHKFPPSLQVSRVQKMLGDEYGTASNIKSRVNRLSVLSAITSAQQRLKLYNKVCAAGCCALLQGGGLGTQVPMQSRC
jgi:peptide chain release factor subunit 1